MGEDKRKRILLSVAVLLLLTLVIGHPLLTRAQVGGHSAYVDLIRSVVWHQQTKQGEFYPRWIPDFYFGHGSPIFLFYAPASYILIELTRTVFDSVGFAIKLAYLVLIFLSLTGMFMIGKRLGGFWGGLAAAAVLGFAPYFLVDLYVRNGIAEFACFAVLPWLFWALIRAVDTDDNRMIFIFSSLFALLVVTHNITSMITAPILLGFVIFLSRRRMLPMIVAYAGGLGLSAWFWLPAMVEKDLVQSTESLTGGFYSYENHFVFPMQLILPSWGWGPSGSGTDDGMSFQIGLIVLACVSAAIVLFFLRRKQQEKDQRTLFLLFALTFFIAIFFTNRASSIFWDHLPLLPFVQFPWRFLIYVSFSGAALASFVPRLFSQGEKYKKYIPVVAGIILILSTAASIQYVKARYLLHDVNKNAIVFAPNLAEYKQLETKQNLIPPELVFTMNNIRRMGATTTSQNDYLPVTAGQSPGARYYGFMVEPKQGQVSIYDKSWRGNSFRFRYDATAPVTVRAETLYFPGWHAKVRGKEIPTHPEPERGWMLIDLPAGENKVVVRFEDTPVRAVGKWISLFTLLAMGLWLTVRNPSEKEAE